MPKRQIIIPIGPSIAYVPLTQGMFSLIDSEDAEKASHHNWSASNSGSLGSPYWTATTKVISESGKGYKNLSLHRLLCPTDKPAVDHANGNPLDNRRSNIRPAEDWQNMMNKKVYKNNKSGHRGVFWMKRLNKWCAAIQWERYKRLHIGTYSNLEDAVAAYKSHLAEKAGEFAPRS